MFSDDKNPRFGKPSPMFGKTHTPESIEKMIKSCRDMSGSNNPMYNIHICGKDHWGYGKSRPRDVKLKISKSLSGELNINWQGGKSFEPYTSEFNSYLKESIRIRDNHTCQLCGKTQEEQLKEINFILSVHHIDYNKKNCSEYNLITLCCSCHIDTNFNRKYYEKYFYLIME
jgi:hypothetical protein